MQHRTLGVVCCHKNIFWGYYGKVVVKPSAPVFRLSLQLGLLRCCRVINASSRRRHEQDWTQLAIHTSS